MAGFRAKGITHLEQIAHVATESRGADFPRAGAEDILEFVPGEKEGKAA